MNIDDAIETIAQLQSVYEKSGLNGNRPITDDELVRLQEALKTVREALICDKKKWSYD